MGEVGHEQQEAVISSNNVANKKDADALNIKIKVKNTKGVVELLRQAGLTDFTINVTKKEISLLIFSDESDNINEKQLEKETNKFINLLKDNYNGTEFKYIESRYIDKQRRKEIYDDYRRENSKIQSVTRGRKSEKTNKSNGYVEGEIRSDGKQDSRNDNNVYTEEITGKELDDYLKDSVKEILQDWGISLSEFEPITKPESSGVNFENLSQQSQQLTDEQLTERAYNYTVENLDKLVDDYISNAGNTIDPDAIREVYKPLGYTGKNVPAFRKAEKLLTETIFEKMIDKAVAEGKTSMTFLTGVPGSGKSSSLRNNNMDLSDQGIVYDAAFNGSDKLIEYIKKVQDRGLKNVTVLAVHNDAITSFTNTINRGIATGRFLSLQYFLDGAFSENIGKIKRLKEKCPDINIIPIDNSGNNGGKQVTVEEAMNWDYNVTEELVYKLLNIIEDEISKGNISGEQITSVGRDVLEIEALVSERNKSIANRINRQIQRNTGNNQGETGLSGLGVNSQSQPTSVLSNLIQPKKGVTALYQKQAGEYANVGNYTKIHVAA
jgi:hypothetical protein